MSATSLREQQLMTSLQQSATVIQKLKTDLSAYTEPIAVVGMGCRFPGENDTPEKFWQSLISGRDMVIPLPNNRRPEPIGTDENNSIYGGFLDRIDTFDTFFFGISPQEATYIDPQQRILLEVSWEAIESAGLIPETLFDTKTGVFIGICNWGYSGVVDKAVPQTTQNELHVITGISLSVAAGRIAYTFGFTGPAVSVDTACSSSLVSVHQACQSLRSRECDMALAGGVNLILDSWTTREDGAESHMYAGDGRCKAFDASASGFGRGEGCGIILLKRLSDAQANGDNILALIRGSMSNQDGRSSGLSAPSGPSQQVVIRQALQKAQIKPSQVSYIEAHGTGTALGDPIEIGAINAVFGKRTDPLWVGSVKTNMAHLEGAAGIAGLIKVILSLQNKKIPSHLHFNNPNPYIDWTDSPVQIPVTTTDWSVEKRIAGISSFGISGTNAHILIEEAPPQFKQEQAKQIGSSSDDTFVDKLAERPCHLLTLSAKTEQALQAYAQKYADFLEAQSTIDLGDLCYTSHTSRSHFAHRLTVTADSVDGLQAQLTTHAVDQTVVGLSHGKVEPHQSNQKIAFLFTGQGAQYVQMGRGLYETEPTFRATLDRCNDVLQEYLGESLLDILYPTNSQEDDNNVHLINQTQYTQPALFSIEYALAALWQSWGIQPDILIGHSIGEIAAACVAGVFSLEDGLRLIAARGQLMGDLPQKGEMVSLLTNESDVQKAIDAYYANSKQVEVSIAALNGPESVVISGERVAVLAIAETLAVEGIKTRRLAVSHAFHSPLMEPMLDKFSQVAARITYHKPKYPLISNLTGKMAGDEILTPAYWVRHVHEAVRFVGGVSTLREQNVDICLEIGPKPVLLGMIGQMDTASVPKESQMVMLPSLREGQSNWSQMLTSLGEFYVRGVEIDWNGLDSEGQRQKITVPTYPFQRQRYWVKMPEKSSLFTSLRPLIDKRSYLPTHQETIFETEFSVERLPFLQDHQVLETVVSPGACHLAMMLSASELLFDQMSCQLTDVIFPETLTIPNGGSRIVQAIFTSSTTTNRQYDGPAYDFKMLSYDPLLGHNGQEIQYANHAIGQTQSISRMDYQPEPWRMSSIQTTDQSKRVDVEAFYAATTESIKFGPTFRWLDSLWLIDNDIDREHGDIDEEKLMLQAKFNLPEAVDTLQGYLLHPGLLDACFQAVGAGMQNAVDDTTTESAQENLLYLPFAVQSLRLFQVAQGDEWWATLQQVGPQRWDIQLCNKQNQVIAEIDGFEMRAVSPSALQSANLRTDWLYHITWEESMTSFSNQESLESSALDPLEPSNAQSSSTEIDTWVIFGSEHGANAGLSHALTLRLNQSGQRTVWVTFGEDYGLQSSKHHIDLAETSITNYQATINPTISTHFTALWDDLASASILPQQGSVGILYLWAAELDADANTPVQTLHLSTGLLHLVQTFTQKQQSLSTTSSDLLGRLWIVTRNSQHVTKGMQTRNHSTSTSVAEQMGTSSIGGALWGLGHTIALEYPQLQTVLVDWDDSYGSDVERSAWQLLSEVHSGVKLGESQNEYRIAYRQESRYVARLTPIQPPKTQSPTTSNVSTQEQPQRLQLSAYGSLDYLHFNAMRRQVPAPGQIEVAVKAAGLNFRDVLNALGMLQEYYAEAFGIHNAEDVPLGFECSGVVVAVGEGVENLTVGDRVMGLANGSLAQYVTVESEIMTKIPDNLSFVEAATIPLAFLTAWYGLKELANLQPDERVLIHAASGGVGQAALQIAQTIGARVYATASKSKQSFLRKQNVTHIYNSRTLDFADEIMQSTERTGVDVVLNSLNGEYIDRSLAALAAQGRFVEIGKIGIWTDEQVAAKYPDIHYYPYDLGEAMLQDPDLQPRLWQTLTTALAAETLKPLPHTVFPSTEAVEAFRYMQQAKHIGKIVISFEVSAPIPIREDGSYLVTGGLGGLGLQVAQQLVDDGAKHLILTGRRGVTTETARDVIESLQDQEVQVEVIAADIAERADVVRVLQACETLAPLHGIVHAAGLIDDGIIAHQSLERFEQVMGSKVNGTWHLHTLSAEKDLDFFVCFSSMAAMMGSPGQSNYAAANAFMDTLMQQRYQQGLPGLSINWGPWAEVGMAAHLEQQMVAQGMQMISPSNGMSLFSRLVRRDTLGSQTGQIGVLPIDLTRFQSTEPFFSQLRFRDHAQSEQSIAVTSQHFLDSLDALPIEERYSALRTHIQTMAAQVLGYQDETAIADTIGFSEMGMDSLMSVEFRNRLQASFACNLPTTFIFDYSTVEAIANYLSETVLASLFIMDDDEPILDEIIAHEVLGTTTSMLTKNGENAHEEDSNPEDDALSTTEIMARLAAKLGLEGGEDE